ncbi:MAG: hypothetical protein CMP39_05580 [Rickettsiales bacterium]|nr:hypothetical protein [Rickettsiales bacterium]|tara:strand:+ start:6296 stop:6583 length:288 start_codon:yes stop_codon:yes gene_type:complete
MEINPKLNNNQPTNPLKQNQQIAETTSVLFNLKNGKKVTVGKAKIRKITKGLAEIAFSLGETADPEEYAESLTEEIYESMNAAQEKIQKTKKRKK